MKTESSKYILCIENKDYEVSLEKGKVYKTIRDKRAEKEGLIRVIDESEEDYLHPAKWFVPIKIPKSVEKLF